jgi:GNAT superfamily N-acetyltransferase
MGARLDQIAERFRSLAARDLKACDITVSHADAPFATTAECVLPNVGHVRIEPLSAAHFPAFQDFYDGLHPDWGLSPQSKGQFDEHPTDLRSLTQIVERVRRRQDARFVMLVQDHVVGYLLIEEIDCIQAGQKTFWGEARHAMIGIGVSDRFHGKGLAAFGMLFLKLVAAAAGVELGLCTGSGNPRAQRFYEKHGFVPAGHKRIVVPHTGQAGDEPWYVLPRNELTVPATKA